MRQQGDEPLGQVAEVAADGMQQVSTFLRQTEVPGLVREAESFARRQPALLLGGGFVLAFLVTRFVRSSGSQGAMASQPSAGMSGGEKG
jgi:hypothetical protein